MIWMKRLLFIAFSGTLLTACQQAPSNGNVNTSLRATMPVAGELVFQP